MNIIDALLGEHAALLTVFDHIQRFQPGWQLPQFGEACLLLESLLATHAILEDELLFDPITPDRGRFAETLRLMREEPAAALFARLVRETEETRGRLGA